MTNFIRDQKISDLKMELRFKAKLRNEVKEIYHNDFTSFMNWENAPDVKVHVINKNSGIDAQIISAGDSPFYKMVIDGAAKANRKERFRALLFHEFTHIYDYETFLPNYLKNGHRKGFSWYTEAHAQAVSLMCLFNFTNVDQYKEINLTDKIHDRGTSITLEDYITRKFLNIQLHFDNKEYIDSIKSLQYFLGCLMFFSKYCLKSTNDLDRLSRTEYLKKTFGEYIIGIMLLILQDDRSRDGQIELVKYHQGIRNHLGI